MSGFWASLAFLLLLTASFGEPTEQTCELDGTCAGICEDRAVECQIWAQENECERNAEFMLSHCPKSCNACGKEVQETISDEEEKAAAEDEFGLIQVSDATYHAEIARAIDDMKVYMRNALEDPGSTPEMRLLLENCKNKHGSCAFWKVLGECEKVRTISISGRNGLILKYDLTPFLRIQDT
jgi:ShK domain-like